MFCFPTQEQLVCSLSRSKTVANVETFREWGAGFIDISVFIVQDSICHWLNLTLS